MQLFGSDEPSSLGSSGQVQLLGNAGAVGQQQATTLLPSQQPGFQYLQTAQLTDGQLVLVSVSHVGAARGNGLVAVAACRVACMPKKSCF